MNNFVANFFSISIFPLSEVLLFKYQTTFLFHYLSFCSVALVSGIFPINFIFHLLYLICHPCSHVFNFHRFFLFSICFFLKSILFFLNGLSVISEDINYFSFPCIDSRFLSFCLFYICLHDKKLRTQKLNGSSKFKTGLVDSEHHCRMSWLGGPILEHHLISVSLGHFSQVAQMLQSSFKPPAWEA